MTDPQPNCLHSLLWDRGRKNIGYHISSSAPPCQADSNSSNMWPALEGYSKPHVWIPHPLRHTNIHTQATWCHCSGAIRGKPKSKVQILEIKGLADRPSFPLSQAGMLLIRRPPQCEPATHRCRLVWAFAFHRLFWKTKKKKKGLKLLMFSVCLNGFRSGCNRMC